MTPRAFASAAAFRAWLEAHGSDTPELLLRLFKTHASSRGLGYKGALDEALCFGWIDGVRHALDEDSFTVRFTPRKPRSRWSAVNVRRAKELVAEGRMRAPGLAAFEARTADSAGYSFESRPAELPPAFTKRFRANASAWAWFQAQAPWYRRTCAFWVMSAKREETRESRLSALVESSARGIPAPPLRSLKTKVASPGRPPAARRGTAPASRTSAPTPRRAPSAGSRSRPPAPRRAGAR
jgi:uncharacterized protein YdeI (YjbR/CyaY-like superfamily)